MMSEVRTLLVYLAEEPIGLLHQDQDGRLTFEYLAEATRDLSIGMPRHKRHFDHRRCVAFFGGLLPESEAVKKVLAARFGLRASDQFGLLRAIGKDCAGAVSLRDLNEVPTQTAQQRVQILSDAELAENIRQLPKRPLFVDAIEGIRLSLAGAQDKGAVCLQDGKVALPLDGTPTTHILKPEIAAVEDSVINEYLCLKLAAGIGLSAPGCEVRHADDQRYLLIERYDRRFEAGQIRRIHQEDFCQALGVGSARKYEEDGGPGLQRCFQLLNRAYQPAVERGRFLNYVLFNYLVGNCDAHGKNFSLLHDERGVRLAPIYDVLCTEAYALVKKKMAMRIGAQYAPDAVSADDWQQFAQENLLALPFLRQTIVVLCTHLRSALQREAEQFQQASHDRTMVDRIANVFEKRAQTLLSAF